MIFPSKLFSKFETAPLEYAVITARQSWVHQGCNSPVIIEQCYHVGLRTATIKQRHHHHHRYRRRRRQLTLLGRLRTPQDCHHDISAVRHPKFKSSHRQAMLSLRDENGFFSQASL